MDRAPMDLSMDRYSNFVAGPLSPRISPQSPYSRSSRHQQGQYPLPAASREEAADEVDSQSPQPAYGAGGPHHTSSSYSRSSHDTHAMRLSTRPPVTDPPGYPSYPIASPRDAFHNPPAGSAYLTEKHAGAQHRSRRDSDRTSTSRVAATDDTRQRLRSDPDWEIINHGPALSDAGPDVTDVDSERHHYRSDSGVALLPHERFYGKTALPAWGPEEVDPLSGVGSQFW